MKYTSSNDIVNHLTQPLLPFNTIFENMKYSIR